MLTLNLRISTALECALLMMSLPTHPVWSQNGPASTSYIGWLDHAGCNGLSGWAADRFRPGTPINVEVYDGPTLVATVLANAPRPDVASFLGDNGAHGFNVPAPANLTDELSHQLSIRFETSTTQLSGSPQTVICAGPPPALSANHYIAFQPPGSAATTSVYQFYRNGQGDTSYGDGKVAVISKATGEVTVVNYAAHTFHVLESTTPAAQNNPTLSPALPVQQNLISNPFNPGPFNFQFPNGKYPLLPNGTVAVQDTAPCTSSGKGYSVIPPPPPPPSSSSSPPPPNPPIVVKIWSCIAFALPMYFEIDDPLTGSQIGWYDDFAFGEPPAQPFVIPAGYADDPSLTGSVTSTGSSCDIKMLPSPLLLFSNSYQVGQGALTMLTDGTRGCVVTNVSILVGPTMSARPVTLLGGPAFHIIFADIGGSNPILASSEAALVTITVSNGMVSKTARTLAIIGKP